MHHNFVANILFVELNLSLGLTHLGRQFTYHISYIYFYIVYCSWIITIVFRIHITAHEKNSDGVESQDLAG